MSVTSGVCGANVNVSAGVPSPQLTTRIKMSSGSGSTGVPVRTATPFSSIGEVTLRLANAELVFSCLSTTSSPGVVDREQHPAQRDTAALGKGAGDGLRAL